MSIAIKNFIYVGIILLMYFGTVQFASAQILDVDFETEPLFGASNFLPGDTVTKTVKVTNTDSVSHDVYTEVVNVIDGGLGNLIDVVVSDGGTLFTGTFSQFAASSQVYLSSLGSGDSVTYVFDMTFNTLATNNTQNLSLGFDFCIGFLGGSITCDDTVPTEPPGGGGGGGSSSSSSSGSSSKKADPIPAVQGAQTSVIPAGAPNAGFGGSDADYRIFTLSFIFLLFLAVFCLKRPFGFGETHE